MILLTSTINPGDFNFVGRKGVRIREEDYVKAINFYSKFSFPIVYVDNSNYESVKIKEILSLCEYSEYFVFTSIESKKGKGHGELEILDFFFSNSKYANDNNIILKISGRYILQNFLEILDGIDQLDKIHYCNYSRNLRWVDSRLMVLNYFYFNNFLKPTCESYLEECNGEVFEKIYARSIHLWMYQGNRIQLHNAPLFFEAYNGVTNSKVSFGFIRKLKYRVYHKFKIWVFKQSI